MDKQSNNMDPGCEKLDIKDIYTPLFEAKEELEKRRKDKELLKKIEEFFCGNIPDFLQDGPKALLVRDIVSPNREAYFFYGLARELEMDPIFVEYLNGKFVAKNYNKYHLCKMYFNKGRGRNGGEKMEAKKIVDFNEYEGKRFIDIRTVRNEPLADLHHSLAKEHLPGLKEKKIYDFSEWFDEHRFKSEYYYLYYLSLFLVHGILFENFMLSKCEKEFTMNRVIPSFKKIEEIFGVKPLIVPLIPLEDEDELYWWCYPEEVRKSLAKKY